MTKVEKERLINVINNIVKRCNLYYLKAGEFLETNKQDEFKANYNLADSLYCTLLYFKLEGFIEYKLIRGKYNRVEVEFLF